MSEAIATKYNGTEITFNQRSDQWQAVSRTGYHFYGTLSEVKAKLDRSNAYKSPRLNALLYRRGVVLTVTITSWDGSEARISYKDGDQIEKDKTYDSYMYDDTPANRTLFEQIAPLRIEARRVQDQIDALSRKLTQTTVKAHHQAYLDGIRGE